MLNFQSGTYFNIPPAIEMVGLRNLAAGICSVCVVCIQHRQLDTNEIWAPVAIVGLLMISFGVTLLVIDLQHVTSGFAAVVFAAGLMLVHIVMVGRGQRINKALQVGTCIRESDRLLINYRAVGLHQSRGMCMILSAVLPTASKVLMAQCPGQKISL